MTPTPWSSAESACNSSRNQTLSGVRAEYSKRNEAEWRLWYVTGSSHQRHDAGSAGDKLDRLGLVVAPHKPSAVGPAPPRDRRPRGPGARYGETSPFGKRSIESSMRPSALGAEAINTATGIQQTECKVGASGEPSAYRITRRQVDAKTFN